MPCSDVTETLMLKLDHNYSIQKYTLRKRTCGAEVGEQSLLLDWVKNKNKEDILGMTTQEFLDEVQPRRSKEKFAFLKHFETLKMSLQVLTGKEDASKHSPCIVEDIVYNDKGVYAVMYIPVAGLDTTKIKACGSGCSSGGCGSK